MCEALHLTGGTVGGDTTTPASPKPRVLRHAEPFWEFLHVDLSIGGAGCGKKWSQRFVGRAVVAAAMGAIAASQRRVRENLDAKYDAALQTVERTTGYTVGANVSLAVTHSRWQPRNGTPAKGCPGSQSQAHPAALHRWRSLC